MVLNLYLTNTWIRYPNSVEIATVLSFIAFDGPTVIQPTEILFLFKAIGGAKYPF